MTSFAVTDADGSAKVTCSNRGEVRTGERLERRGAPRWRACPRSGALVLGDWNTDGRADGLALAPTATGIRARPDRGAGTFTVTAGAASCAARSAADRPRRTARTDDAPAVVKVDNTRPRVRTTAREADRSRVPGRGPHDEARGGVPLAAARRHWLGAKPRMTDSPILPSLGARSCIRVADRGAHGDPLRRAVAHRYVDIAPSSGGAIASLPSARTNTSRPTRQ